MQHSIAEDVCSPSSTESANDVVDQTRHRDKIVFTDSDATAFDSLLRECHGGMDVYRDLTADNGKRDRGRYLIAEGRLCVESLLRSPLEVASILCRRNLRDEVERWAEHRKPELRPHCFTADASTIAAIAGFAFHRGVLAAGVRPPERSFDDLLRLWTATHSDGLDNSHAMVLSGVSDRENYGSIIRSASGLGIRNFVQDASTGDAYNRRTIRTSMATVFNAAVYHSNHLADDLRSLRQNGGRVVVTGFGDRFDNLVAYRRDDRPTAIVVGHEFDGVDSDIIDVATDRVTIPMSAGVDSMGVAAASAVVMHHILRAAP